MKETPTSGRETMGLLRVSTAGSVDDGKSTLIGRLLYESQAVFDDHLAEIERVSRRQGDITPNLALLTDGLRAEREQGITIDVAYRYFSTAQRRFILADTPGHAQYTRNMVSGMSTADAAIVLVDAARGITVQSRRHLILTGLLRVPHTIVCVNKMDLVHYEAAIFQRLEKEVLAIAQRIGITNLTTIPVAALHGANVVQRSTEMPWYQGPVLIDHLETVPGGTSQPNSALRFPVQWVGRTALGNRHHDRLYGGRVMSGLLQSDMPVYVQPSGLETRIKAIELSDRSLPSASAPMSINVRLADDLDVTRGDMICSIDQPARVGQTIEAIICWLAQDTLRQDKRYAIKHTTRSTRVVVTSVQYKLDVNTLTHDQDGRALGMNDIGRVTLRTTSPLCYDTYADNRGTGSFILIDEVSHETVGAGMIV